MHQHITEHLTLSLYRVDVAYATETTDWDTYGGFTVQAYSAAQAEHLCRIKIGEFHAPFTLRTEFIKDVDLQPQVLATEPVLSSAPVPAVRQAAWDC